MPTWLTRHSEALEGPGGLAAAFATVTALIVIRCQIAQSDRIQRDQTAREIQRELLNLAVQKPDLANADCCASKDAAQTTPPRPPPMRPVSNTCCLPPSR